MTITIRPAKRENVHLLIGLMGGTSSGKTESSMKLATGLAGGQRFCVIDTEAGRALHKADRYDFDHADLRAPFTPEAYIDAVQTAAKAGYGVIVVDSASHEYDGAGGVLDIQTEEFKRMGFKESARMSSWIEPKRRHRAYVNALLQVPAHIILCHRAEDKIEIVKENGKTVVRPKQGLTSREGWLPICERRLPFELTLSILVLASAPGVPHIIKAEDDHRPMVPLDRPLDVEVGRALAAWAAGSSSGEGAAPVAASSGGVLGSSPAPVDSSGGDAAAGSSASPFEPPSGKPASAAMKKKLNVLVGKLRDGGHITNEQLYQSCGVDPAAYLAEDGLHWSPLRDMLTAAQASELIGRLERYQANLASAA